MVTAYEHHWRCLVSSAPWHAPLRVRRCHDRSATMTMPLLMLVVLIITFGVEVGWLCRC